MVRVRLSLFTRLSLGYLAIFLIVAAASAYAILGLRHFGALTESILSVDNRILDDEKFLVDLLLGQSRAEQKYVITKDQAWFIQYTRQKNDFEAHMRSVLALDNAAASPVLKTIEENYRRYTALVDDEGRLVRANRPYPQSKYKQDKDALIDAMLNAFEKLRANQQQVIYTKVADIAGAAGRAERMSLTISILSLLAIVTMSLLVTRSITGPIGLLKSKTRDIAQGNFEGNVEVKSPPEISELADALNAMSQKLRELDHMKADFFASMSHELRTPLTSIKEGTGLLLEGVGGTITEKQRKLVGIIAEESNRLINLVNSLLDLSKMEAGMMAYDFTNGNVDTLIKRAIAEIAPLLEAKQIRLESALAVPLPLVNIDSERILQVLRNLLSNAVKFTPRGGQLNVSARRTDGALEVAIKDSGPGIPVENLLSIFEKFNQGDRQSGHARLGTGLGLAIAKNIVLSHGGKIWAESQLGQGSTFIFVLPC